MNTPLAKPPRPPTRLVVVHQDGVAVYEGRKCLAFNREVFDYTAAELEEIRTAPYLEEVT